MNDANAVPAVHIYTDGACKGNPGPGGWGVLLKYNGEEREMFGGEAWQGRLSFMEPAGDRWWAIGGAVYMLQAIKRVRGMRLITPAWQERAVAEKPLVAAAKREGQIKHGHLKIVK